MLPSQEEVVQLLLTSPFSAAQVIISGWVQSRLRNGSSRIKATNDVVALREALPPFFSNPVDKALLACGLPPRPIVPPAGCQAAVNAGSSLVQVLSSITTARGRNRAYVRECVLEYIAQKEARASKSMSLAERDKEIIAKLNRIEAAQSTTGARLRRSATTATSVDPNSPPAYTPANQSPAEVVLEDPIVAVVQRVRVEKGLLDEPHLLKLILHPTIEPSRIESILVLFIRRQILTQGRHATSEILTRVQFSTYQRADAPEGIHDAFTSARFLSGLGEEHETRTDARLSVSQGLAQKDSLATILVERVLKKKDSREQEILLKESLREWIVLVVYAGIGEGRLWWGGGESKNESGGLRAKVGVQVDELDRLLCFNHPHVRFLRSVIAAFRKIHDFPTSLPLYEEPVTSSLPIESLGLNPPPDCPFIGTGPSDAPLSAQIFETPDLIKDHPTLQVVFSRLIALAEEDFSAKEAVLLDWVSNQWETIILTGREWGREDRANAGADLALLEASIDALLAANPNSPGCKEFSPAFESVRRSPVLAGSPTPSQGRSGIQSAEEELWETLPAALASGSGSGSALASGSGSFTAFDAPGPSSGPYNSSPPLSRLHPSNEAVAAVADAFSPSANSSSSSFSSAPSRPPSVPLKPGPLRSTPNPRSSSFSSQSSSTLNRRESRPLPTPHPFGAHDGGSFISSASSSSASSLSAPTLSTSVTSTSSPSFNARRSSAPAFSSSPPMRGTTLLTEEHTVPESPDDNDPFADPSTPLSLDSPSPPHLLLHGAAAYHQGFSPTATSAGNDAAQATIARWSASQPLLRALAALEALDPQSTPHAAAVIQDVLLDFIEDDAAAQAEAAAEQAAAALASSGGAGGSGVEKGGAGSPAREAELRVAWSVAKLEEVVLRSFGGGDWGFAAAEREGGTSTAAIAKVFARLRGTRPTPLPAGAGPVGVPAGRAISFSAGSGVGGSSSNGVRRAGSGGSNDPSTPHRPGLHSMTVSAPSVVMSTDGRPSAGGGGGAVLPGQMAAIGTSSATTPMPHLSPPPTEEALPPYSLE